jgi:hypothetical protein
MTTIDHDGAADGAPDVPRRRPAHRWVTGATVLLVVLSACGLPASPSSPPARKAPPSPTTSAQTAPNAGDARDTFLAYYQALQDRDFATACALHAPETTETLLANVRGSGIDATGCIDALTQIYDLPEAAARGDEVARSATVDDVVVEGGTATITWSSRAGAKPTTTTSEMRLLDGRWRVFDTSS